LKIKEINIASFGGIKNLKLTPDDGFNVIYGDNENGKSTIMAFIKMMFYGNGRNSSDISKNIRKKYTPWDGSPMAGSIDFEHSGRLYRLEREFRKSDATDKIVLCDLDLGTRTVAPSDIGTKFFSLTAAGFERSVFIGQFGFPEGDPEGEIGKRLSNIVLTGEESVSFETVNNRLLKAKTALMSKSGNAGVYDKNVKAITELNEKLQKSTSAYENYEVLKENLQRAAGEIFKLQKRADELKERISEEQDVRNAEKLKTLLETKAELDTLNKELTLSDGNIADESYVKKLQFCISRQSAAKAKLDNLTNEIDLLKSSIADGEEQSIEDRKKKKEQTEKEIAELESRRSEMSEELRSSKDEEGRLLLTLSNPDSFKKKVNPLLLATGSAIFIAGAVAAILLMGSKTGLALASITAVVGLILFILSFVLRPTDKNAYLKYKTESEKIHNRVNELEFKLNDTISEISALKARFEAINTALNGGAEMQENNKKLLSQRIAQLPAAEDEYKNETEIFNNLFMRYTTEFSPDGISDIIDEISSKAGHQKELKQQINYILKDVGNISYEEAAEKLKKIETSADISTDFDAIKTEYDSLVIEISNKKTAAATDAVQAENTISSAENPEKLRRKITELASRTQSQKEYCDSLNIAMEVLAEANIEVRRSFGSELEKKSAEILSRLTNGKYEAMSVSKALDIAVEEKDKFGSREIDYLSSGTADQAYLSLRLAISELMSGDSEALPVLMDDALAQYDDNRTHTALEFLKEYSKNNQIILFTCHKAMYNDAQNSGANAVTL